jgi:hypothetical protein
MEGKVVKPLARKTKKCKKRGIVRTRTMPIASPRGDGLRRAFASSPDCDMMGGSLVCSELNVRIALSSRAIKAHKRHVCSTLLCACKVSHIGLHPPLPPRDPLRFDLPYRLQGALRGVAYTQPRNSLKSQKPSSPFLRDMSVSGSLR